MMNKVNILVVDDRPEGILAVQAVLNSPNYNIVTASSGNEALKHLLQDDFAVILLDVQMPIMNGFETASVIKTREKSKDIPIIFMSAINQDEQYVYQGYGVGAIDYLLKPFDPYILRSKVAIFVDIYRKNQLIKEQAVKLRESEAREHAQEIDRLEIDNLRRYQNLADSIPQIVFRLLPDGKYEYFNKVWFEYTGLTLQKSLGFDWKESIHPKDVESLKDIFGKKDINEGIECECRILNKSGDYRYHLIRIQPEKSISSGELSSWLGTATDIEDRKKSEEHQRFLSEAGELLVSTLDYRKTLESIADLSIPFLGDWCSFDMVDESGEITNLVLKHQDSDKLEQAKLLHDKYLCDKEGKVGAAAVIKTGKLQVFDQINDETLNLFAIDDEQIELAKKLGDTAVLIVPISLHGRILGAITFARSLGHARYTKDSVELSQELARRVALALENSNLYKLSQDAIEVRNDFLSIASHELNTPITSLKLQLQMVRKGLAQSSANGTFSIERFTKSVDASVKQVDRLINLIQILLDVSRIQSGKFTFSFSKTSVQEIVHEVLERHKEIIQNADCELEVLTDIDADVVWDKTRVEQVLTNLLTNAIKYAPGKIHLSVKQDGPNIQFSVQDFGEGINPHKLKTIFDRFERATTKESVSGLGLGLFIVKQITEGHHGKVEVESEEKKGTVFTVTLPKDVTTFVPPSSQSDSIFH
jgi:PAS domain S-box-containing protein